VQKKRKSDEHEKEKADKENQGNKSSGAGQHKSRKLFNAVPMPEDITGDPFALY